MNKREISYENLSKEELECLLRNQIPFTKTNEENIRRKFYQKAKAVQRKKKMRKYAAAAAVFAVFCISTAAYAKTIGLQGFYRQIFGNKADHIVPYAAKYDRQEGSVCTDNGIEVRLISAVRDEKELVAFLTVTDKEGDRLSKNTAVDEFDTTKYSTASQPELIDYDEETKTATFIYRQEGQNMDGRITLDLYRFFNPVVHRDVLQKEISLQNLLTDKPGKERESYGGVTDYSCHDPSAKLLEPNKVNAPVPGLPWLSLSNAGFIDGALHIQTHVKSGTMSSLNDLRITDKNGKTVAKPTDYILFFDALSSNPEGYSKEYTEMEYKGIKNAGQLKDCQLLLDYTDGGTVINGHWKLSFQSPRKMNKISWDAERLSLYGKDFRGARVLLTPMGVYVDVPKKQEKKKGIAGSDKTNRVTVKYKDGKKVKLAERGSFGNDRIITYVFMNEGQVIESDKVEQIVINDKVIK